MDIFKGKIELKCIETTTAIIDNGVISNLGVTYLGVSGNAVFNKNVTFNDTTIYNELALHYAPAEYYDDVTFYAPITVDSISITSAIAQNLNATNISSQNTTINNLGATCVDAEKINVNQLGVSGSSEFYGPVTFHSNVYGITSGDPSINGVSGFLLDVDGDVNIAGDLTVGGQINFSGILNSQIGIPTDDQTTRPIDISTTGFTNDIGLNLTPSMFIADGFQIIDQYLKTYFLTPPPGVTLINCISTAQDITIEWENFPKIEYAPLNIYLPHVEEMRIDYVESSLSWSDPSKVTIHTTSRDTNKVIFHIQGSGSGLSSTTWNEYTIQSGVNYNFRIYAVNHHSGQPIYLEILNKSTTPIGIPSAPTSFTATKLDTTSIDTSWTKPIDHDNITSSDNTQPIIQRYAVDYVATNSVRYPTFITDSGTKYTTVTVYPNNSATTLGITGLNPGTEYTLSVAAKNAINANYGPESNTDIATTDLPEIPPILSSSDASLIQHLSSLYSPYLSNGGYSLDGETIAYPILNIVNINGVSGSEPIRTTITPKLLNNGIPGTTLTDTATLTAYGGFDNDYGSNDVVNVNLDGFSHSSKVGNYDNVKVRLRIEYDGDYYTTPSDGFYKAYSMYAEALNVPTNFPPSINKYVLGLEYNNLDIGTTNVVTDRVNFYIDDLNDNPLLSGVYITEETLGLSSSTQISGVPTYKNNASFRFQFTISNIANHFLRHDRKHADVIVITSNNSPMSDTLAIEKISNVPSTGNIDGTIHQYFDPPSNLHQRSNTLHNSFGQVLAINPGDIQIHTFEIPLTSLANNKFDENFTIKIIPYNLYTANNIQPGVTGIFADPNNPILTLSKLRIDTKSIENDRSNSSTTETLGRHVQSGLGTFPEIGITQIGQAGGDYDHSQSILSGNYAQELQLVNGLYQSVNGSDGYKNYNLPAPNNYYFSYGYPFYDYSIISNTSSSMRYTTFKYTGVIPSGQTRERLRITINEMTGLTVDFTKFNQANHQLWLKIVDIGDGTNIDSHTSTVGWLDCTNTVGQSGVMIGLDGTRCINGATSTASQRDCYIRPGTSPNATIYIRIGIPQNVNAKFKSISCRSVSTFNEGGVVTTEILDTQIVEIDDWRIRTYNDILLFEFYNGYEWVTKETISPDSSGPIPENIENSIISTKIIEINDIWRIRTIDNTLLFEYFDGIQWIIKQHIIP